MRGDAVIQRKKFEDVDLADPFFDSLKDAYKEFSDWFRKKHDETAFVVIDEASKLQGFMYLKEEHGPVTDVDPPLNARRILKVGTFKINAHGTRLGERFVKKIFDYALARQCPYVYVTVFPQHEALIGRLKNYGFVHHGEKKRENGCEDVYVKSFTRLAGNICLDYPLVNTIGKKKWLLSIWPMYHSPLFPDSLLKTEDASIVEDLSFSNSIHKAYISFAPGVADVSAGDVLVMYRTAEEGKAAEYSSVATSICVVEEVRQRESFRDEKEFLSYCQRHSVFSLEKLRQWYKQRGSVYVVRMTYNIALPKRLTRHVLAEEVGLDRSERWTLLQLTDGQFRKIREKGQVYEGVVIDQAGVR